MRQDASTPKRQYASTPVRLYASMSVRQYASMPVCQNDIFQLKYQNESCSECHQSDSQKVKIAVKEPALVIILLLDTTLKE